MIGVNLWNDMSTKESENIGKKVFTFFWLDGKSEIAHGDDIASAFTSAGYGNGAMKALDFYSEDDTRSEWLWDKQQRKWVKPWDNEQRTRYYGLRRGDLVEIKTGIGMKKATVVAYGAMDNNRVHLKIEGDEEGKEPTPWVAEWCRIILKVEDKENHD